MVQVSARPMSESQKTQVSAGGVLVAPGEDVHMASLHPLSRVPGARRFCWRFPTVETVGLDMSALPGLELGNLNAPVGKVKRPRQAKDACLGHPRSRQLFFEAKLRFVTELL